MVAEIRWAEGLPACGQFMLHAGVGPFGFGPLFDLFPKGPELRSQELLQVLELIATEPFSIMC